MPVHGFNINTASIISFWLYGWSSHLIGNSKFDIGICKSAKITPFSVSALSNHCTNSKHTYRFTAKIYRWLWILSTNMPRWEQLAWNLNILILYRIENLRSRTQNTALRIGMMGQHPLIIVEEPTHRWSLPNIFNHGPTQRNSPLHYWLCCYWQMLTHHSHGEEAPLHYWYKPLLSLGLFLVSPVWGVRNEECVYKNDIFGCAQVHLHLKEWSKNK